MSDIGRSQLTYCKYIISRKQEIRGGCASVITLTTDTVCQETCKVGLFKSTVVCPFFLRVFISFCSFWIVFPSYSNSKFCHSQNMSLLSSLKQQTQSLLSARNAKGGLWKKQKCNKSLGVNACQDITYCDVCHLFPQLAEKSTLFFIGNNTFRKHHIKVHEKSE